MPTASLPASAVAEIQPLGDQRPRPAQSWGDGAWPNHPSALDVADAAINVVGYVVETIRQAQR